jgi:serine/threonine-protein kinase
MNGSVVPLAVRPVDAHLPRRLDRYELIGEIARGGMGTVLLARLAGAGGFARLFAIKLLHPHLAADEQFVHMLLDEARLASRIHHSNAVPVVDVCQSEHGFYVVMDYIEGFTFNKILNAAELSPDDRIRVGVQALLGVLAGLEAAHNLTDDDGASLGIVHRDVSPSNVLVGLDGVGRIADFGIAHSGARITHTEPGLVKGKVAYMAPEQAQGLRVDRRADVFGVGVMLWECLAGQRLFKAETEGATVLRLMKAPIGRPSAVQPRAPREIDAVCLKALERDVSLRYASAHQMAAELSRSAERAGCLATSIQAADLLRSRFGEEITGRQAAIRARCATLTSGEKPSLPQSGQLRAVPPPAADSSVVAMTAELPSVPAPSSSLRLEIAVDPPRPRPLRDPRVLLALAGVLVSVALVLVLVVRGRHAPSVAAPSTVMPPSPPPVVPLPTPAVIPPPPAATVEAHVEPASPPPPRAADKRHAHGTHSHGTGTGSPHPKPTFELNPYLHR